MSSEFFVRLWCEVLFFHVTFRSRLECFYIRLTDNTFCFRHTHALFMCEALNVRINMALYIFKRTVIYLCQFTLHLTIIFQRLLNVFKFLLAYLCISWHDYSPAKSRSEERRVGKGCRSRWR